jgi:hypothetical protein
MNAILMPFCRRFVFKGTPGRMRPKFFLKIMIALHRSVKMRVVCALEFVQRLDISGDTEVESLGGLRDFVQVS